MIEIKETRIAVAGVRSLVWDGDTLFDWVEGGRQFTLDGEIRDSGVRYPYPFDAAIASPSGEFSVIYTRFGTKGLILRRGEVLREINRSYYHADVYEFPVALIRLGTGREVIVHCPDAYNRLEIDDLATGERLIQATGRKPSDFFHSRLAGSPDGRFLVSAGWAWHPIDVVQLYDLATALTDPSHLDGYGLEIETLSENGNSAAFLPSGQLAVDLAGAKFGGGLSDTSVGALYLFDPAMLTAPKMIPRADRLGTMMPVGMHHILGLYEYPKLFDLRTGEVVQRFTHINCGAQASSMLINSPVPPIALDPLGQRCAIADAEGIIVLEFRLPDDRPANAG